MGDDEKLAELFRSAAGDPAPAPAFGHDDVVTASRRITARRRTALVGGLGLLALVGLGASVVLPQTGADMASTASAPLADDAAAVPGAAPEGALSGPAAGGAASDLPDALRGLPPFTGIPLGPGTTECADRQDPALRALVEQVFPEAIGAPAAATTMECRPPGERGVSVEVADGSATGLLTVTYLPPGSTVSLAEGFTASATASGGTVLVGSRPVEPGGPVPFEGRLDTAAAFLAERL